MSPSVPDHVLDQRLHDFHLFISHRRPGVDQRNTPIAGINNSSIAPKNGNDVYKFTEYG